MLPPIPQPSAFRGGGDIFSQFLDQVTTSMTRRGVAPWSVDDKRGKIMLSEEENGSSACPKVFSVSHHGPCPCAIIPRHVIFIAHRPSSPHHQLTPVAGGRAARAWTPPSSAVAEGKEASWAQPTQPAQSLTRDHDVAC